MPQFPSKEVLLQAHSCIFIIFTLLRLAQGGNTQACGLHKITGGLEAPAPDGWNVNPSPVTIQLCRLREAIEPQEYHIQEEVRNPFCRTVGIERQKEKVHTVGPQFKVRLQEHPELAHRGRHGGIGKPSFHLGNRMMVEAMETDD